MKVTSFITLSLLLMFALGVSIHACFSDENARANTILGKIREHREIFAETSESDDELWLVRPQRMVIQKTASMIQGAKRGIRLYGHDCTWLRDASINAALAKANKNHVPSARGKRKYQISLVEARKK